MYLERVYPLPGIMMRPIVFPDMGLKRDNRARQRMGKLLDLTKRQQEERIDWQSSRPLTKMDGFGWMFAPDMRAGFMSWSFARVFDFEKAKFTHIDMPGSVKVDKILGRSNVVRTDTTDRIQRSSHSVKRNKLSLMGD